MVNAPKNATQMKSVGPKPHRHGVKARKISINQYAPQVLITDLKIKNETIKANDSLGILEKSIGYTKTITLDYDKANFSINFAIPNYIRSKNNQYSYRLTGLENNWTTTKNTEAIYAIQNPGTYIFEVKGANNDGIWNQVPSTLTVIVKPAPWRSIWALLLYGIVISLGLYGLIWIMKSKARLKHKLEMEYLETKRIEENNSYQSWNEFNMPYEKLIDTICSMSLPAGLQHQTVEQVQSFTNVGEDLVTGAARTGALNAPGAAWSRDAEILTNVALTDRPGLPADSATP